jgi:anti-sigma B factor antagonist
VAVSRPDCGGSLRPMSAEATRLDLIDDVDGTLVAAGEIDSYTAPALAERLSAEPKILVLDLAGVSFIDSSGLRILIEAHQSRMDADSSLTLRSPSAAVQRLLEISGLSPHLDVTA